MIEVKVFTYLRISGEKRWESQTVAWKGEEERILQVNLKTNKTSTTGWQLVVAKEARFGTRVDGTEVSGVNGWCSVGQKATWNKETKHYSSIRAANVSTEVNHWGLQWVCGNFPFQGFFLRDKVIGTNNLLSDFTEINHPINYRKPRKTDRCPSPLAFFFFFSPKGKIFLSTNS